MADEAAEEEEDSNDELGGLFKVLKKASGDGSRVDKHAVNMKDCNHLDCDDVVDLDQVKNTFFFPFFFFCSL